MASWGLFHPERSEVNFPPTYNKFYGPLCRWWVQSYGDVVWIYGGYIYGLEPRIFTFTFDRWSLNRTLNVWGGSNLMHFGMVIFVRDFPEKIGALFGLVSYNDPLFFPLEIAWTQKMLSQKKIIVKKSCPSVFWLQHLRTNGLETIQIIEFAKKIFVWWVIFVLELPFWCSKKWFSQLEQA